MGDDSSISEFLSVLVTCVSVTGQNQWQFVLANTPPSGEAGTMVQHTDLLTVL